MTNDVNETVETTFHVRYAETDAMGIVHHSSYVVWFEEGRSAWGRAVGLPYSDLEAKGFSLALIELHARYVAPAYYDQRVTVRTCLKEARSRAVTFEYEVVDAETGKVLATGSTRHICIDAEGKPVRLPDFWLEEMAIFDKSAPFDKITPVEDDGRA